jgi:hypothetical protein
MPRLLLCPLAALLAGGLALSADGPDTKDTGKGAGRIAATVQKANPKDGTVTVELEGKSGKEKVRTFKVTRDTRLLSVSGEALKLKDFPVGTKVFLTEREGRVVEMRVRESPKDADKPAAKKPPDRSPPDK